MKAPKILLVKPKAQHAEHTAACLTVLGIVAAYYPPFHILEGAFFGAGGFLAIYANRFPHIHHVSVTDDSTEE